MARKTWATERVEKCSFAAVLDGYGGIHYVAAHPRDLKNHVRPGQIMVAVPDLKVRTPVPWDDIPYLIELATKSVERYIAGINDPDVLAQDAIKLYQIRKTRGYQLDTVNLYDICET